MERRHDPVSERIVGAEEQEVGVMVALTALDHGPAQAEVPSSSRSLAKLAVSISLIICG